MQLINAILGVAEDLQADDLLFVYGKFMKVVSVQTNYRKHAHNEAATMVEVEDDLVSSKKAAVFFDRYYHIIFQRPEKK